VDPGKRLASTGAQSGLEYLGMLPEYALMASKLGPMAKGAGLFVSQFVTNPVEEGLQGEAEQMIERGASPSFDRFLKTAVDSLPATAAMAAVGAGVGMLPSQNAPRETPPPPQPPGQMELPLRIGFGRGENATLNHMAKTTLNVLDGNDWAGATVNARHGDMAGKRAVATAAVPEAERIIDGKPTPQELKAYMREWWPLLRSDQLDLGVWFNGANGKTYLDVTTTPDNYEAAQNLARGLKAQGRGKPEGEIAGFNLETFEEMPYTYPPDQPEPEQLRLPLGVQVEQDASWAPYKQPGTDAAGARSTVPGGHDVRIYPARGGWRMEGGSARRIIRCMI
jgi:hypothetical protein